MKLLVPVKRVPDSNVKERAKADHSGVDLRSNETRFAALPNIVNIRKKPIEIQAAGRATTSPARAWWATTRPSCPK
jgi:electron transfer flavoprotein alpha/beta subunit